jgi:hypothetical protein
MTEDSALLQGIATLKETDQVVYGCGDALWGSLNDNKQQDKKQNYVQVGRHQVPIAPPGLKVHGLSAPRFEDNTDDEMDFDAQGNARRSKQRRRREHRKRYEEGKKHEELKKDLLHRLSKRMPALSSHQKGREWLNRRVIYAQKLLALCKEECDAFLGVT